MTRTRLRTFVIGLATWVGVTRPRGVTPPGPEGVAVRDNWSFSRSDLFFGLPFYHTGVRATYPLRDAWTASLAGYNGWSSVVDNNDEKSIAAQLTYTLPGTITLGFLYFTGVERPPGAPEGRAWRHDFDAHATFYATPWLSLLAHFNAGFEPGRDQRSGLYRPATRPSADTRRLAHSRGTSAAPDPARACGEAAP